MQVWEVPRQSGTQQEEGGLTLDVVVRVASHNVIEAALEALHVV